MTKTSKKNTETQTKSLREHLDLTVNELIFDKDNVRKVTTDIKALAANIKVNGLIENLVVKKAANDKYAVVAGSRRLSAIKSLEKGNEWDPKTPIKCQLCTEEEALEISLAENLHRQNLNPADEFIAFQNLIDHGTDIPTIAQTHGITETVVKKRLKLASLSPTLIEALRNQEIDLHKAMAFTLTNDHKVQDKIYYDLKDCRWGFDADNIRGAITNDEILSTAKHAVFVGLKNYKLAGGSTREDLFEEDIYIQDTDLLQKLVKEKILKIEKDFISEGWKWAEFHKDMYQWDLRDKMREMKPVTEKKSEAEQKLLTQTLELLAPFEEIEHPTEQDIETIKELMDKVEVYKPKKYYTDNMKSYSGVTFTIDHTGEMVALYGWVKKEDDPNIKPEKKTEKSEKKKAGTSNKLKIELAHVNWNILRYELMKNPEVAADLFIFESIVKTATYTDTLDISISESMRPGYRAETEIMGQSTLTTDIQKLFTDMKLDWKNTDNRAEAFKLFRKLPEEKKRACLAYLSAYTLNPSTISEYKNSPMLAAQKEMRVDTRKHWTPDEVYFKRLNTDKLIEIGSHLLGTDWTSESRSKKKKEIVEDLHNLFAKDSKYGTKEARKNAALWCPEELDHSLVNL